jgi:hypothetical protein
MDAATLETTFNVKWKQPSFSKLAQKFIHAYEMTLDSELALAVVNECVRKPMTVEAFFARVARRKS